MASTVQGHKPPEKRSKFTIREKLEILRKFDSNSHMTKALLAQELKIPVTTLQGIISSRAKIESEAMKGSLKRQKMKQSSKYHRIEEALTEWLRQARNANSETPITGTLMKIKAKEIASRMGIRDFTASDGWVSRYRKRFAILSPRAANVDEQTIDVWTTCTLPRLLKGYELCDQYNADEFGLYLNLLPNKSLFSGGKVVTGSETGVFRVTVLLGTNADGSDRLTPMVVGESASLRSLGKQRPWHLPCPYECKEPARMSGDLFNKWLGDFDTKMRVQNRNVLLFVDDRLEHPKNLQTTNVKLLFLPRITTSRLRPFQHGIIKCIKYWYRTRLVKRMLLYLGTDFPERELYIDLPRAMHYLVFSWQKVSSAIISKCFKKAGFKKFNIDELLPKSSARVSTSYSRPKSTKDDADYLNEDFLDFEMLEKGPVPLEDTFSSEWAKFCVKLGLIGDDGEVPSFNTYVSIDDRLEVFEKLTLEQIITAQQPVDVAVEDEDNTLVSAIEAHRSLENVARFISQQEEVPEDIMELISKLETVILNAPQKQRAKH